MIVTCPNCNLEQPLESGYCPKCGGQLKKLLAEDKVLQKKEHYKTRAILTALTLVLFLSYIFIFLKHSPNPKQSLMNTQEPKDLNALTRSEAKQMSSARVKNNEAAAGAKKAKKVNSASLKQKKTKDKKKLVSAAQIKNKKGNKNTESLIKEERAKQDPFVNKEIQSIELLDSLNCEDLKNKLLLNNEENRSLEGCSQTLVSDIQKGETFILEEDPLVVSMSLLSAKPSLEVILTIMIEGSPLSSSYIFTLPQTRESSISIVFPIRLKPLPGELQDFYDQSSVLPLLFRADSNSGSERWSPLLFHATL